MKKLLFIISAVLVSVMGWGAELVSADSNEGLGIPYTLNPYAYDLNSTWDEVSQQLTVHFKLNSPPNLNDGTGDGNYNTKHLEPNGLQIFAVDPEGNKYRIGGPGRATIQDNHKNNGGQYDIVIDIANGVNAVGNEQSTRLDIPRGVPLTWEVWVKGRSETGTYTVPRLVNATVDKQPYKMAGVAIGTNPYAENFAKTFIANTDNGGGLQNDATYGWLYTALQGRVEGHATADRTPALLEYTANLKYAARHRKGYHDDAQSWFSSSHTFAEPHRVRVSEDGRVFVSSYLYNVDDEGYGWAIAEYLGENSFKTIIQTDFAANKDQQGNQYAVTHKRFNRRPVDFDVKGSGENLKMVVAWVDPRDRCLRDKYWWAKVECVEYEVGKAKQLPLAQDAGTLVAEYDDYNPESDKHGLIFQGYAGPATDKNGDQWVSGEKYYNSGNPYTAGQQGFIGVAYGKGENNPIWMKVDFGINKQFPAHILYFDNTGNTPTHAKKDLTMSTDYTSIGHYGGHALVVTEDYLITADGRHSQHLIFYSLDDLSKLSGSGAMPYRKEAKYLATTPTDGTWINGLALDYANNLYIVSAHTNNVYTFGLPYSGKVVTPAPLKSEYTFMLPHLASGLEYHPYYDAETKKGDKYKFSFNVDDVANPTAVEICFYDTKDKMLKGGDDYSFYYEFSEAERKQGRMSVVFDAVGGTVGGDKLLNNPNENENAYLNLPRGEYYWNVRVSRNVTIGSETHTQVDATPAPEEYCFLPERLSQGMDAYAMADVTTVYGTKTLSNVAIYRPMKSSYYNTFCVPFDVESLAGTCYEGAELLEFTGVYLNNNVNGESILELQFSNSGKIVAGVPYLLKPVADINTIVPLGKEITFHYTGVQDTERHHVVQEFDDNSMTYAALLQRNRIFTNDGLLYFILVDNNRLARVLNNGEMLGLRGYFMLAHELPAGTQVGIAERKTTPTSIIDLNGTQVDVEKFMREGRVYIRVGESLYTLSGERVELH